MLAGVGYVEEVGVLEDEPERELGRRVEPVEAGVDAPAPDLLFQPGDLDSGGSARTRRATSSAGASG